MKNPILQYFEYKHLPEFLQNVSKDFHDLAHKLAESHVPNPELSTALRKLLESKDCAVRSFLETHSQQANTESK